MIAMLSPGATSSRPGYRVPHVPSALPVHSSAFVASSQPLNRLVQPRLLRDAPIHNWFVFPHSFAPALVADVIESLRVPLRATVGDPFVGSGTTALTAQLLGREARASDLMPLAVLSTRVKTTAIDSDALDTGIRGLRLPTAKVCVDRFGTVEQAFEPRQLDEIDRIITWIVGQDVPAVSDFLSLALARAIEPHSKLRKSGGWLKRVPSEADSGPILPTFKAVVSRMIADVRVRQPLRPVQVSVADARELPWEDQSVDLILTSPPYLNKHDYTRVFCLELAIACRLDWGEIKALRHGTLRSHVESHDPPGGDQATYQPVDDWLNNAPDSLDRRLPRLVRGYFQDMADVLRETKRVLRPAGAVVMVVGDVRFAGTMLPVAELLDHVGKRVGLEPIGSQIARYRGNSAQQMKSYGRVAAPEWILAWRT